MLLTALGPLLLAAVASADLSTRQEALKGDRHCSSTVCVETTVNGTLVNYFVSATKNVKDVGWIGVGFGSRMVDTPLVIMWANPDGSMTLSQRETSYHVMPKVDDDPELRATAYPQLSMLSGSEIKFAFSVPLNDRKGKQNHVYAMSLSRPSSSAVDAAMDIHNDVGYFKLDFDKPWEPAKPEPPAEKPPTPTEQTSKKRPVPTKRPGTQAPKERIPSPDMPLNPQQRLIVAHALFGFIGWVVCLPLGAILARWLRTYTPTWFKGHWMIQSVIAGPPIFTSIILAIRAVSVSGGLHFDHGHKKWGLYLFLIYLAQGFFGVFIHLVKSKDGRRPIRNYGHAVLGLGIMLFAFRQVRTGYNHEWYHVTGGAPLRDSFNSVYWGWFVTVGLLYLGGLVMLRRQFRQERENSGYARVDMVDMQERRNMSAL